MNDKFAYLQQQMQNMDKLVNFIMYIPNKCSKMMEKVYYYFIYRFHPDHKYHLLDTGLPPGYYDLDNRILYAVMKNFTEFYKHSPHSFFSRDCNWDSHPEILSADEFMTNYFNTNRPVKDDLDKVYDWWIDRYLKITKDHEDYWESYEETEEDRTTLNIGNVKPKHSEMFALEETLEEEANEMLQLLMKRRRCLWD